MKKLLFANMFFLIFSTYSESEERKEMVGCWEATLKKVANNIATICYNHEIGSITYYYTNEGDSPTRCYQHAFLKYEKDSVLLEGAGGFCDNGRKQIEMSFRCWNKISNTMPCEMYLEHTELEMKKVEVK